MKQYNDAKKVQLFPKNVKYGQNLNSIYGCHAYQIRVL